MQVHESSSLQSLTFFEPLKEEGPISRSGILQSVLGFFGGKKQGTSQPQSNQRSINRPVGENPTSAKTSSSLNRKASASKINPGHVKEHLPTSSFHYNDVVRQRPNSLSLHPVYKMKHTGQGSDVEIRIRDLSNIFKDLPKKIVKTNQPHRDESQNINNSEVDLRQYWMPDKDCHECYECNERFTTFRRRHHCRVCGHIFCSRCCFQLVSGKLIGYMGMVRSCTYCYKLLKSHAKRSSLSYRGVIGHTYTDQDGPAEVQHEVSTLASSSVIDQMNSTIIKPHQRVGRSRSLISMRGSPVDDQSSSISLTSPPPRDNANWASAYNMFDVTSQFGPAFESAYENEEKILAKTSIQLHDLWMKITDDKDGAEFRDHRFRLRKFTQSITGSELVDWLMTREIAASRDQACVIGQALLDAEWIKSVTEDRHQVFHDAYSLYQYGRSARSDPHSKSLSGILAETMTSEPIPCSSRLSLNGTKAVDMEDEEPNWVREINEEEDNDVALDAEVDGFMLWGPVKQSRSSLQPLRHEPFHFAEGDPPSPISVASLSSFVEIDNEKHIIKYQKKSTNEQDSIDQSRGNMSLKEPRFVDEGLRDINADSIRGYLAWNGNKLTNSGIECSVGWREADLYNGSIPSHAKQAFIKLQKLYFRHSMCFLRQLFIAENLDVAWADVIVPLAKRICQSIVPDCDVNMDIMHYVHVKKFLDAPPCESQLVKGVVFTKNVIHSQMKTRIDDPNIMLLSIPLEYQRVNYKLSSLDPIVRQEPEFFKHLISRILDRNPDLIISECGVSHPARRLLLEAGVSLIINVKKSVMERLSRSTGAVIARSIDQIQSVELGNCGCFHIERHYDGKRKFCCRDGTMQRNLLHDGTTNSYKIVAYLDGCDITNGCTVFLKDSPDYALRRNADAHARNHLSRVKNVFFFLLRIMYHSKLEISYLMDQQDFTSMLLMEPRKTTSKNQSLLSKVFENEAQLKRALNDDPETKPLSENDFHSGGHRTRTSTFSSVVSDANTLTPDLQDSDDMLEGLEAVSSAKNSFRNSNSLTSGCNAKTRNALLPSPSDTESQSRSDMLKCFSSTLLSYSPLIPSSAPYLLTDRGHSSILRHYLPSSLYWSDQFPDNGSLQKTPQCRFSSFNESESEYEKDKSGIRSRSGTTDSFDKTQSQWRPPPHQSDQMDEGSSDSTNLEELELDAESETKPVATKLVQAPGFRSSSYRRVTSSQTSIKSSSAEGCDLTSGERSVMCEVLDYNSDVEQNKSRISLDESRSRSNPTENDALLKQKIYPDDENVKWSEEKHSFLTMSLSYSADTKEMKDLLADFRANGSSLCILNPKEPLRFDRPSRSSSAQPNWGGIVRDDHQLGKQQQEHLPDCLDAHNHQHIYVLFSSYSLQSPNAPYPCVLPWAVDIDYYWGNDITFGGFLERYCFRPSYHCPSPSCNRPMVEHVRSFVHGNTCMNILLKELSKPISLPYIVSWCWDPKTKTSTELKALSDDAWSMSFAKFLELRLETYSGYEEERASQDDLKLPAFTSFQYFLYKNMLASIKCFKIDLYDVALPPQLVRFDDISDWKMDDAISESSSTADMTSEPERVLNIMNSLSKAGDESMDSIQNMIEQTRANTPFDAAFGSDSTSSREDVALLNSRREAHFDELMFLFQQQKSELRGEMDQLLLKLQSFRKSQELDEDEKDPWVEISSVHSSPGHQKLPPDSHACTGMVVVMETNSEVSRELLQIKCQISRLVYQWNHRIGSVFDKDRQSRKAAKSGVPFIVEYASPVTDAFSSILESKMKTHPNLASVPEGNTDITDSSIGTASTEADDDSGSENARVNTKYSLTESVDNKRGDRVTDMKRINDKKDDEVSSPITIPSHHYERTQSQSSSRKFSKSTSTLSMFVSNLLSTNNLVQVPIPFSSEEHYLLQNCCASQVVVRDSEPGSIVAYTLRSDEYIYHTTVDPPTSVTASHKSGNFTSAQQRAKRILEDKSPIHSDDDFEVPMIEFEGLGRKPGLGQTASNHFKHSVTDSTGSTPFPSPPASPSITSPHIEVQFKDATTKFYCKVYFASEFKSFREKVLEGTEEQYITSLSRCVRWAASGGKSGSAFHKTLDDRLVLKQMSRFELGSFLQVATDYLAYVSEAVKNKSPTTLSKILGVYRVSFRNSSTNRTFKQDILVMENLFYKRNIQQVYDLKGSVRNRHVKTNRKTQSASPSYGSQAADEGYDPNQNDLVLLDENLLSIMRDHPLYVHEHSKILIKKALADDAKFLASHLIIDYSLLVGIDSGKKEIVVGIIDYLRTFTWDKKLEMMVKSYGMISRQAPRSMPTVVAPELYRSRFCEAMERYFQVVPDRWFGMQTYNVDASS